MKQRESPFGNLYFFTATRSTGTAQSIQWRDYGLNDGEKSLDTRPKLENFLFYKNFRPAAGPNHPPL